MFCFICQDNEWRRYWCVLQNNVIFIFTSQRTSKQDSLVGRIELGPESRLENREGDGDTGYRFDLYTRKRLNKFKTAKFTERELWRAYVEGIATGTVPENIDLLPGPLEDIRVALRQLHGGRQPQDRPLSCRMGPNVNLPTEGFDSPNASTSGSFQNGDSDNEDGYLEPASPLGLAYSKKWIFHQEPWKTDIPCWFYSLCTREVAEKILSRCKGLGNTLMRESPNTRNLVISKRMEAAGGPDCNHFIIKCDSQGYKIDVENPHGPMKSLSEVMDFFVHTSGESTTHPMQCNDLKLLGLEDLIYDNNYSKKIVSFKHDADSGEKSVDTFRESPAKHVTSVSPHSQTTRSSYKGKPPPIQELFDTGPPEPPAPPPPLAHHKKTGINMVQPNTLGPQGRWNTRSKSVPSISPEDLAQAQAIGAAQTRSPPGTHVPKTEHYVNTPKHVNSHAPASPHQRSSLSAVVPGVPPLPPNHPPPLSKQENSGTASVSENVKRTGPKHSQSMGAADAENKKAHPKHSHSASTADESTKAAAARITNKSKEPPPVAKKPQTVPSGNTTPKVVTESFKKKLEGLIVSPVSPPGQGPRTPATPTQQPTGNPGETGHDIYENIEHYQNANEIKRSSRTE